MLSRYLLEYAAYNAVFVTSIGSDAIWLLLVYHFGSLMPRRLLQMRSEFTFINEDRSQLESGLEEVRTTRTTLYQP